MPPLKRRSHSGIQARPPLANRYRRTADRLQRGRLGLSPSSHVSKRLESEQRKTAIMGSRSRERQCKPHADFSLSELDATLARGLDGEEEDEDTEDRGDEERWRQRWYLTYPGRIAQVEAVTQCGHAVRQGIHLHHPAEPW
jgi:hypothetical protein